MVVHASNRGTQETEPAWTTWEDFVSESKEKNRKTKQYLKPIKRIQ